MRVLLGHRSLARNRCHSPASASFSGAAVSVTILAQAATRFGVAAFDPLELSRVSHKIIIPGLPALTPSVVGPLTLLKLSESSRVVSRMNIFALAPEPLKLARVSYGTTILAPTWSPR